LGAGTVDAQVPSWEEVAYVQAPGGGIQWLFGDAVAMSGDVAAIGAPLLGDAVYIYQQDVAGDWNFVRELNEPNATNSIKYGETVALDGDTLVVGDPGHIQLVYIYERDEGGSDNWGLVATLTSEFMGQSDDFGGQLALFKDTLAVGDRFGGVGGDVYIFDRNEGGSNNWGRVALLKNEDEEAGDRFGNAVALSDETLMVGAPNDDDILNFEGSVSIFERDLGGANAWSLAQRFVGENAGDNLGLNLALQGDVAIFGGTVRGRDVGGAGAWGEILELHGPGDPSYSQYSIEGDLILAAQVGTTTGGGTPGVVDIFDQTLGWEQIARLTRRQGIPGENFGSDVVINEGRILIGVSKDDVLGGSSGSAFFFEPTTIQPALSAAGACPGVMTFSVEGATPFGRIEYWFGDEGSDPLPAGGCVDAESEMVDPLHVRSLWTDDFGDREDDLTVGLGACGKTVQVFDSTTCTPLTAVVVP